LSASSAFGACFMWGSEWCTHVWSPVAMYFRSSSTFVLFRQTSWYPACALFVVSQFFVVTVVNNFGGHLLCCGYLEMWPVYFQESSFFTRDASTCAGPAGATIHEPSVTFSDMLNPHYATHVHHLRIGVKFWGEEIFLPRETNYNTNLIAVVQLPPCIAPNWHLRRLLDSTSTWAITPNQQTDCLINKTVTGCRTLLCERTSQICLNHSCFDLYKKNLKSTIMITRGAVESFFLNRLNSVNTSISSFS
jgi:hypothetical protein